MRKFLITIILISMVLPSGIFPAFGKSDTIKFDFEDDAKGWDIPDWAYNHRDYKSKEVLISDKKALEGEKSLEVVCDFPGNVWAAVIIERKKDMDLSDYDTISASIYLPRKAPRGFYKARFILTVGVGWHFIEMRHPVDLIPGRWNTVKAKLEKSEEGETQWKGRGEKRLYKHIDQIKKIGLRIEYDAAPPHRVGSRYRGPIYIDNIIIEK